MADRVHCTESVNTDSRITLGSFESGVSEHLGDVADVSPAFEHQGCNAVTQKMATSRLLMPDLARQDRTLRQSQSGQIGVPTDERKR
jgi:hypothetical protein